MTRRRRFDAKAQSPPRRRTVALREAAEEVRLNKYIADAGIASRRKADELIAAGAVKINGRTVTTPGVMVRPAKDSVSVSGQTALIQPQLVYILLNKPKDCISTTSDEKGRKTVLDLVPGHTRLYPVGRLDRNTTGVLLLTNDGDLAWRLTHPKFRHARIYRAGLNRSMRPSDLAALRNGIELEDGKCDTCEAEALDPPRNFTIAIAVREGRNRLVRRMFEAMGYEVSKLERIAFADLTTRGLKRGAWRYLEEHEVNRLRRIAASAPAQTGSGSRAQSGRRTSRRRRDEDAGD